MKQIGDLDRSTEWRGHDVSTLCDAVVFPAFDHRPQKTRLHRHFYPESPAWLDGDRLDYRDDLGMRGRRAAARLCNCWSGPLLHAVRSDDAWRSFLPNLRSPVVAPMIRASGGVR